MQLFIIGFDHNLLVGMETPSYLCHVCPFDFGHFHSITFCNVIDSETTEIFPLS